MPQKISPAARVYDRLILGHHRIVVLLFAVGVLLFGYNLRRFRMDASSESLVLENDSDLKYYERTRELFGSDDYIILAISVDHSAVSDDVLGKLDRMGRDLQ